MHYTTLKTEAEINEAAGIKIKTIWSDKTLSEIHIGELVVKIENYFVRAYRVTDFIEVTRYRVTATITGFDPKETLFEHEYEAKNFINTYPDTVTTKLEKIQAKLKDDEVKEVTLTDDIPF